MTRRLKCLLWIVGVVLWPCLALAQTSYDLEAVATDVADQLAQRFPYLRGEVADVQGQQLYLSLGSRNQVLEGMRLSVFREGRELTSPTTGEVLGRLEEDLGTITVTQVAESYAVATLEDTTGSVRVRAGDKVRITAGRLSLALIPAMDQTEEGRTLAALAHAVRRALNAGGRFNVVPEARLTIWLSEKGVPYGVVLTPEVMAEAGHALGVTYIAQLALLGAGDAMAVELRLFAPSWPQSPVTTAVAMVRDTAMTPPLPPSPLVPQSSVTVSASAATPESSPVEAVRADRDATMKSLLNTDPFILEESYTPLSRFPTELRGFDAADIDGDGLSELVMLSDAKVLIYRVHENQLISVASYSDRRPGSLLSAQFVRLGGGQVPGVVVNRYSPRRKGMDSFILALQGNKLVRQQRGVSDILLAVDTDGDGLNESVWGQAFDKEDFFWAGRVRRYDVRKGRLKRQHKLSVPGGFRATGAALAQLRVSGDRQLVFVDDLHNLQVYDGTSRLWKSRTNVGGGYVFARMDIQYSPRIIDHAQFDFEAIPAVADFDGDGIDEVLVPQNQSRLGVLSNLNLYSGGHVAMMRKTPQGFTLTPISPRFDGVVSGVVVLKGRTPGILVAISKREGVLKQRRQTILYLKRL